MEDKKYFGQQCQDEELNKKFRQFHKDLVNQIIKFCKDNNIIIDEFKLGADMLIPSIEKGEWCSSTDSYFSFLKYSNDYKDVIEGKKIISKKEYEEMMWKEEPFIFSM